MKIDMKIQLIFGIDFGPLFLTFGLPNGSQTTKEDEHPWRKHVFWATWTVTQNAPKWPKIAKIRPLHLIFWYFLTDLLHTDSKNASENDGEVRFALILANKIRRNFLCPK